MKRRTFPRAGGATALLASVGRSISSARVSVHNFAGYPFGAGPPVTDRLYQGPFSADDFPSWNVVMATTPSEGVVPNYGMGLITYVCDEVGPAHKEGETLAQSLENLVKLPLGSKLYIRVNWRDVQQRPGRLDFCEHWKLAFDLARRYQKRVGFRVMMSNPDIPGPTLPDFLVQKVPMVAVSPTSSRQSGREQFFGMSRDGVSVCMKTAQGVG